MDPALHVSQKHYKMMELARKMAIEVPYHHKHGAVLVKGGAILAKGKNCYQNLQHAETAAIGKHWESELKGATLYICRLRRDQMWGNSRPCPKCMVAVRKAGISVIIYTTDDPNLPISIEKIK
jgi:pyrimidine deaminase RibD-like protein